MRQPVKKIILDDGTIFWFRNNTLHRKHGPAVIYPDGTQEWWFQGRRHHPELFAITDLYGKKIKIRNGKIILKYWDDNTDDMVFQKFDKSIIDCIERTPKTLMSIPIKKLLLPHVETIDSDEKDTVKIFKYGMAHSDIGPAELKKNGTSVYFRYGLKHCEHSPAIIDTITNSEYWYYYGVLHRDNGPAVTKPTDASITYSYFTYGLAERKDGPAEIIYNTELKENILETWMRAGRLNRTMDFNKSEGPAMTYAYLSSYNKKTGEIYEAYFRDGGLHNLNGPASLNYTNDEIKFSDYFINDERVSVEKFNKIKNTMKKFIRNISKPIRHRLSQQIIKSTNHPAFCKDVCDLISNFIL